MQLISRQHTFWHQDISSLDSLTLISFSSCHRWRWKLFSTENWFCATFFWNVLWTTPISFMRLQWFFLHLNTIVSKFSLWSLKHPFSIILNSTPAPFSSPSFPSIYEVKKLFAMILFLLKYVDMPRRWSLRDWEILAGKEEQSMFLLCAEVLYE